MPQQPAQPRPAAHFAGRRRRQAAHRHIPQPLVRPLGVVVLHELSDQVVEVLTPEGKLETRVVQRGLSNDQSSEIIIGLDEGDEVVLPTTQTRSPNVRGGFGAPGLGPGAGGVRIRGG